MSSLSPPPLKIPFAQRREREFLYLSEVDALITTCQKTRAPIRNQAIAMLLFCQALQPIELCWLRWCDLNFANSTLLVSRRSRPPKPSRYQPQIVINLQLLCPPEIDILQQLSQQRTTDWLFASERKQRLSERSLHHLIQQAGDRANLPIPVHPYVLKRSGMYYRAALLLQPLGLSLRQCCLLWNWYETKISFSTESEQEYRAIEPAIESAFLAAMERIKAFSGITTYQNTIDYLLGAFLLFPQLQSIPQNYWLTPSGWDTRTLPKTSASIGLI